MKRLKVAHEKDAVRYCEVFGGVREGTGRMQEPTTDDFARWKNQKSLWVIFGAIDSMTCTHTRGTRHIIGHQLQV